MLRKLKIKFVCINMLIVTILMCIIFALVINSTRVGLVEESQRTLEALAVSRARPSEGDFLPPGVMRLPHIILQFNEQGRPQVSGDAIYDLEDTDFIDQITQAARSAPDRFGVVEKYSLRFSRAPGPVEKLVFVDISGEQAMLAELYKNCALIGTLSFFAFLTISIFLANWAVSPVARAWDEQRQFVGDASHELKTPLTVIRANAELLCQTNTAADRQRYSENILVMSGKMRSLIERMLELARADSGQIHTSFERLDISALCTDALLPFEPVYFEKGLELESAIDENIFVRGSTQHLRQLLDILLDNAGKHSLPGVVRLTLKRQGHCCVLTLENPSAEISVEDRKNIFRRFYRLDKARSANGSYGLGLSIAESIVRSHRGRIRCDWESGKARFTVTFPAIQ